MARLKAVIKPPASGAIIFYGRSIATSTKNQSSAHSDLEASSTSDGARSLCFADSEASSSNLGSEKGTVSDQNKVLESQTFSNDSETSFWPIVQPTPANSEYGLEKGKNSAGHVILRLVKDISNVFQEVPYVKIVAGLVQQIVNISDVSLSLTV
jgi:hypothetical protein